MSERKVFGPASEAQRAILMDNTTDIILCGGGSGGGKSTMCLLKNIDSIHDPYFRCVIARQTEPELKRAGGLIDESSFIYNHFGGVYKAQAKKWVFPSGCEISFAGIPDNKPATRSSWQGSQITRLLIDEVADWEQDLVLFLLTRLRSAHSKTKTQLIMTCNPDRNSFLYNWVEYSLDPETGIPRPDTKDRIRWFVQVGNELIWADSIEELELKRGDIPEEQWQPKTFRFIPLTVYDNPVLLKRNPDYLVNLLNQSRIYQQRYLHGRLQTAVKCGNTFK